MSFEPSLIESILIAIAIGIIFFLVEYFENPNKLHPSLIAGISIAYFFLLVLPEILTDISKFHGPLETFVFLPVLFGFTIIHIAEKIIFKNVEKKTKERARKLLKQEKDLECIELRMAHKISNELKEHHLNPDNMMEIGKEISGLDDTRLKILEEFECDCEAIGKHINNDFHKLRNFVNYSYHFFSGFIIIDLFEVNFIAGILFSIFVLLMTLVRNKKTPHKLFYDLNVEVDRNVERNQPERIFLSSSVLLGIVSGVLIDLLVPINLEMLYQLFGIVSGVILYIIIKNDLPDTEEGNPVLFAIGILGFTVVLFIIKFIEHSM